MAGKWSRPISEIKNNLSKIIGKTYKGLTILEVMDSFDGKEVKRVSKCQCPCGNIVYENFPDVLYGDYIRKYCCPQKKEALKALKNTSKTLKDDSKVKDYSYLINKTFGDLTVLEICQPQLRVYPDNRGRYKRPKCVCRCSCGKIVTPKIYAVLGGYTTSCGHISRRSREQNLTMLLGTKLGRLKVLSIANLPEEEMTEDRVEYICKCDCGFKLVLSINDIATKTLTKCPMCQEDFISKTEDCPSTKKNQNGFGLENITWSEKEQRFVISTKRGDRYFRTRATSLDEAIEKRKELLKEADEFAKTLN